MYAQTNWGTIPIHTKKVHFQMWPKSRQRWFGYLSVWFTQNPVRCVCVCGLYVMYERMICVTAGTCHHVHVEVRKHLLPVGVRDSLVSVWGYVLRPWASVQVSSLVSPSHLAAGALGPQMHTCTHPHLIFGPALCDLNSGCQVYMTSTFIHWAISRDLFLRCLLWGTARLKHDSRRNNKYKW